jgi:hypothetical protein
MYFPFPFLWFIIFIPKPHFKKVKHSVLPWYTVLFNFKKVFFQCNYIFVIHVWKQKCLKKFSPMRPIFRILFVRETNLFQNIKIIILHFVYFFAGMFLLLDNIDEIPSACQVLISLHRHHLIVIRLVEFCSDKKLLKCNILNFKTGVSNSNWHAN